jgi:predicted metal-dependent hydrolase
MNIIQESYTRLFPDKTFIYQTYLEYNRRLSDFNANIKFHREKISVHLNLQWKDIDNEIKIGLIQHLLLKVFKKKRSTPNIDLYNNFTRNIDILIPKTNFDPILEKSFERVNSKFFFNQLKKPNLIWGQDSRRKLASYNFHNDTVSVSTLFNNTKEEILDFLMYHELLHKHHKFKHKNGRSSFHTPQFKRDEASYPRHKEIEKEIEIIIKKKPQKRTLWNFFG